MLCSAAMDEGKREVRIISSVSYSFFLYIIQNRIIWQAVVPFLLLTLLLQDWNCAEI